MTLYKIIIVFIIIIIIIPLLKDNKEEEKKEMDINKRQNFNSTQLQSSDSTKINEKNTLINKLFININKWIELANQTKFDPLAKSIYINNSSARILS